MDLTALNWAAVVAAAVATFGLGGLWYGPLFGTVWTAIAGVSEADLSEGTARIFGFSFLLQLVAATVLAMAIGPDATFGFSLAAAGSVGLFWVAPAFGVVYLFERRPLAHWAINAGYYVVSFLLMGVILGLWK